jgi:hypothetical protein
MFKKEFCPQKQISIQPGTDSGMVMHYALRIFISKSGASGFDPTNTPKKKKPPQQTEISL